MGFFGKLLGKNSEKPLQKQSKMPIDSDWRGVKRGFCKLEVRGSYQIPALGTVIVGIVSEGILKNDLSCMVREKNAKVRSIERKHSPVREAVSGEMVSVALEGVTKHDILPGDVLEFY